MIDVTQTKTNSNFTVQLKVRMFGGSYCCLIHCRTGRISCWIEYIRSVTAVMNHPLAYLFTDRNNSWKMKEYIMTALPWFWDAFFFFSYFKILRSQCFYVWWCLMSRRRKVVLGDESAGKIFMCNTEIPAEGGSEITFICICIVTNHVPWDSE